MDPVRKKACPLFPRMPDLEHLEGITMLLRPPRPAPAARPAAGAGRGGRRRKIFRRAGRGVH